MKLIIDVPEEVYEALKGIAEDATSLDPYSLADIIVNKSKPYEERPQGELIQSLTELCNRYCENCPVPGVPNECTDCICIHIRGIMKGGAEE